MVLLLGSNIKISHLEDSSALLNELTEAFRDRSLFMQRGEGEKRRRGQGYFRLAIGGRGGLNFFIKKFRGVTKLIARYILTGVHWPRWVRQLNSRALTIYVKR